VAERAGVSHAAPYAHFSDKQALIAAISTQGFRQLYNLLAETVLDYPNQPHQQLVALSRAYARFALEKTETFRLMFSSSLESEKEHKELSEVVQSVTDLVRNVVSLCMDGGTLAGESAELAGVIIWGQVHGIILLFLENQIPSGLLQSYPLDQLVEKAVDRATTARGKLKQEMAECSTPRQA